MTKTESAEKLIKTLVIESCEQLLDFHGAEGVRAAIPNTNNLIMVGPADWIAKNLPGVEAMTGRHTEAVSRAAECVESYGRDDLAVLLREVAAALASQPQAEPVGEFAGYLEGIVPVVDWVRASMPKVGDKLYLGATTQASTAQAERVPEGWKLVALPTPEGDANALLKMGWAYLDAARAAEPGTTYLFSYVGYRAMLEWTESTTPVVAASSTDAQAAAEVRDAAQKEDADVLNTLLWLYRRLPRGYGRLPFIDASIYTMARRTGTEVGEFLDERNQRAGDTGEQADGGAHAD